MDDYEMESKAGQAVYSEKATTNDFKADAITAENAEHNMGVLDAVRAYPMASFWAVVMSCTIVSNCSSSSSSKKGLLLTCSMTKRFVKRLWNPTTSS